MIKSTENANFVTSGELSLKNSFRGGAFIGCSNYPECKFTRPLIQIQRLQLSII